MHQSHRRCLIFSTCGNLHSSVYGRPTTSYFLSAGSCSKLNAMGLLFGTNVCFCSTVCKQTSVVCRPCSDDCGAGYCINVHCKKSRKLKEKMSHSLLSGGITLPAQQRRCPCCCLTMPPAAHNEPPATRTRGGGGSSMKCRACKKSPVQQGRKWRGSSRGKVCAVALCHLARPPTRECSD